MTINEHEPANEAVRLQREEILTWLRRASEPAPTR